MAWAPQETNPKIIAVNELLKRHNAGDPDAANFTPELANTLRSRFADEAKATKPSNPTLEKIKPYADALRNIAEVPFSPMKSAMDIVSFARQTGGDLMSGRSPLRPEGPVDVSLLRGQIPQTAAMAAAPFTGPLGVGAAGAGGMAAQQGIRSAIGLPQAPPGIVSSMIPNFPGKDILAEGATQSGLAYGGQKTAQGAAKVLGWLKNAIKSDVLPAALRIGPLKRIRDVNVTAARDVFDAKKITAKMTAKDGVAALSETPGTAAAANLQQAVKTINDGMEMELKKAAGIVREHGNAKVSVEPVRQKIVSILDRFGMVDPKGNIIPDSMSGILTSEQRAQQKYLQNLSETLQENPTIYNLDRIRKVLQESANFGAANRTATERMYGELSHDVRMTLLDGLEASTKGTAAGKTVAQIRANYTANKPLMDEMSSIADQYPEQIAARTGTQLPGTLIKDAITKQPALRGSMQELVLNDLVGKAKSPEAFTKAIDKYGRDTLKQLLDGSTYNTLIKLENQMFQAWQLKGQKFEMPLGKFWQGVYDAAQKGQTIKPENARAFFVAVGNQLGTQMKGLPQGGQK